MNKRRLLLLLLLGILLISGAGYFVYRNRSGAANVSSVPSWGQIPNINFTQGISAYWNVEGSQSNNAIAISHGFKSTIILNTYADYKYNGTHSINTWIHNKYGTGKITNPWDKPSFFEQTIRDNLQQAKAGGGLPGQIVVHDIEEAFEPNAALAWQDPAAQAASHTTTLEAFTPLYYQEVATWYTLPLQVTKEYFPGEPVGLYGRQPFQVDYWGYITVQGTGTYITNPNVTTAQLAVKHAFDAKIWAPIDPYVDFYVSNEYAQYDLPDAMYAMAANMEQNYITGSTFGSKPIYAYNWLRVHSAAPNGPEVSQYIAEAEGVLPYFTGAKATVLWGFEPQATTPVYVNLLPYVQRLKKLEEVASEFANAVPDNSEPAYVSWIRKQPLVRKMKVSNSEWLILAMYPYQADTEQKTVVTTVDNQSVSLTVQGKEVGMYIWSNGELTNLADFHPSPSPAPSPSPSPSPIPSFQPTPTIPSFTPSPAKPTPRGIRTGATPTATPGKTTTSKVTGNTIPTPSPSSESSPSIVSTISNQVVALHDGSTGNPQTVDQVSATMLPTQQLALIAYSLLSGGVLVLIASGALLFGDRKKRVIL